MSRNHASTDDSELTEALEMYIKTIFELENEFGSAAPSDIAMKLSVKAPSVTSALQKLDSLGMVEYRRYQHVKLTSKGNEVARMLNHRHQTLLDFLLLIGVDEEIAMKDACEIEHVVNKQTIQRLSHFLQKLSKKR
jgi:DtxR family Mn-dependent transcriptional regulator